MNSLFYGIHLNDIHYTSLMDALNKTVNYKANVLQIYMGNKTLTTLREKYKFTTSEFKEIKTFLKKYNIKLFIHAILSLNFCKDPSSSRNKWGIDNLIYDMNMCYKLGGIGVVIHLGSKVDVTYDECIINFTNSLVEVLNNTKKIPIILETPVNRKNTVGGTIESLLQIYNNIPKEYIKRIKICIDTQHVFASGFDIKLYLEQFSKNLALIHLNDSEKEFNSKINRHAPIGKGFIFSNNNELFEYIINFAHKNNIPLVLETKYENYNSEIKYIKDLLDLKPLILKIFKAILSYYETLGKTGDSSIKFKISSYRKAINTLELLNKPIYNSKDVKNIPSIGKGFCEKINIISQKGTLNIYENIKKNNVSKYIIDFQNIFGIGPEKARYIISKKIYTIKDLKDAVKHNEIKLSDQQLIGLKYYDDLKQKIPRNEITNFTNYIKKLIEDDNIQIFNAGSYRIGKLESGDIDLIISFKNIKLDKIRELSYNILKQNNIIIETLSSGKQKSIYIINFNNKYYKIDIAYVENNMIPWYLLYFGSSREFSKHIRSIASKLGYKLNEKGLFNKKTNSRINFNPKDEKEIFNYLKIDYIKPENR
jgi:DNA polymerase beta